MKNKNFWQTVAEAKKNGGCGRMMFQRTADGHNRVCGINGQCDLCRQKAATGKPR